MTENVIKGLTVGERAWIRRYARAGMPMAELADYASAKADASVSSEEVKLFLNEPDGSTNGGASPDPANIVSGGLTEVLKLLNPAQKAWIRIGYSRGKSPSGIAAALTAKHGIRVDSEEVAIYVGTPPRGDEALPSEEISTIEDLARRIANDVVDEDLANLSEAETSDRYIKPFFKLLGWDFQNPSQVKQNRFNGKGVRGQTQFDIHLDYGKARSIVVEAKRFLTAIVDASGGLRSMHQKQFKKYLREKPRILVFTNGKELIASDQKGLPVLVIKHPDWALKFDDAKKLMGHR